jgi:hypothetical protein
MADTQIPSGRNELVDFYEKHYELWVDKALEIGLSVELAAAVKTAAEAAIAARNNAGLLRNSAKMGTTDYYEKADALRSIGGAAVATIRAFADATDNKTVYITAAISPPAPPTPAGPPSPAVNFTADPRADGMINLKWKGTVAQNASFDIERCVDSGPYVLLDNVRTKSFLDKAVPMNTNMIVYRIYGKRDGVRSTPETATVLFGNLPAAIQAAFRSGPAAQAA